MKTKKIFLTLVVLIAAFVAISVAKAGSTYNVIGWAGGWSTDASGNYSGVGWISMNSLNCSSNGTTITNSNCGTVGTPVATYGVTFDPSTNTFSGYAWDSTLAQPISFNSADVSGCPSRGNCQATVDPNGNVTGWARFVGIEDAANAGNSGGWDGWISLNSLNCSSNGTTITNSNCGAVGTPIGSYGVKYDPSTGNFSSNSLADSNELGFIDFSGAYAVLPPTVTLNVNPNTPVDITALPEKVTLSWTVANCDASKGEVCTCTASTDVNGSPWTGANSWTGSKSTTNGSQTFTFNSSNLPPSTPLQYTLSCTNQAGQPGSGTAHIDFDCTTYACGSDGGCDKNNTIFTIDQSKCSSACTSSKDCISTNLDWKEVSPN